MEARKREVMAFIVLSGAAINDGGSVDLSTRFSSGKFRKVCSLFVDFREFRGGRGRFSGTDEECDGGGGGEEEGEELVSGEAEEGLGGGAEEFVGEAEEAVGEEVEVEVLAGEEFAVAEEEEGEEGEGVEGDFDGDGGPVGGAVEAVCGEGAEVAGDALATAVAEAAEAAEDEAGRDDEGVAVAGGFGVGGDFFGEFDGEPSAEEGTGDGLAGEPMEKAGVGIGVEPAFGEEVGDLGAEEGAGDGGEVDEGVAGIGAGLADPEPGAEGDGRDHRQSVDGGAGREGEVYWGGWLLVNGGEGGGREDAQKGAKRGRGNLTTDCIEGTDFFGKGGRI